MKKSFKLFYAVMMCFFSNISYADTLPEFDGAYIQTKNDKFIELKQLSGRNEANGSKCIIDNAEIPAKFNLIELSELKQFVVVGEKHTSEEDLHRLDNGGNFEQGYEWFCRLQSPYIRSKTRQKDDVFYLKPNRMEPGYYRLWRGNSGYSYAIRFK